MLLNFILSELARSHVGTLAWLRLVGSVTECYGDIPMYGEGHLLFSTDSLMDKTSPSMVGGDAGSSPVKLISYRGGYGLILRHGDGSRAVPKII